jgi:hypothetical protein
VDGGREWEIDWEEANYLCDRDPAAFFSILQQQKHTLERLSYSHSEKADPPTSLPVKCTALSGFERLREVAVSGRSSSFEEALRWEKTAPPNLSSLATKGYMSKRSVDRMERYQHDTRWLLDASAAIKSLRDVTISTSKDFTSMTSNEVDAMKELGKLLESRNVHLHMFSRRRRGAIPPILYKERGEVETLEYESEGDRFLNPATAALLEASDDQSSSDPSNLDSNTDPDDEDDDFMDELNEDER